MSGRGLTRLRVWIGTFAPFLPSLRPGRRVPAEARGLCRQYGYGEIGESELDRKLGEIQARARSEHTRMLLAAARAAMAEKAALRRLYREGALSREDLRMLEAEIDERLPLG